MLIRPGGPVEALGAGPSAYPRPRAGRPASLARPRADTLDIPPLHEDLNDVRRWGQDWTTVVGRLGHRLVTAARGRPVGDDGKVGRLMVAPDLAGQGVGRWLLASVEASAPEGTPR